MCELLGALAILLIWVILKGIKEIKEYNKFLDEVLGKDDKDNKEIKKR